MIETLFGPHLVSGIDLRIRCFLKAGSSPLHGINLLFLVFKGELDQYFGGALDRIALPAPSGFVVPEAVGGAGDNLTVVSAATVITRAAARWLGG